MTTQRTSRALAREAAGLCLTAVGVLGVLVALGLIHWAMSLTAVAVGMLVAGALISPKPDAPRYVHIARWTACGIGYGAATVCGFVVFPPIGWFYVSLAVIAAGLWLASRTEGA